MPPRGAGGGPEPEGVQMADDKQWWYNTNTHQVEQGAVSPWTDRAGPYKTREEAEGAPKRIAENSRKWAEEEAREDR